MKFNKLIPELSVRDINKSKIFYCNVLEFKVSYERIEDKFVFLSFEGSQIMLEQFNNTWTVGELIYPSGRGINLQIETKNIQKIYASLNDNNIKTFKDLVISEYKVNNDLYKEHEFLVQDPDGYLLRF